MANVLHVGSLLKGRIHHDAVVGALVLQEVTKLDVVSFCGEDVCQGAVPLDGRKSCVWVQLGNSIENRC